MNCEEYVRLVKMYQIPETPPEELSYDGYTSGIYSTTGREQCIQRGMWPIVSRDLARRLAIAREIDGRVVLEIMAGAGWLAKALQDEGVTVIATDDGSWNDRHNKAKLMTDVEVMEASAAVLAHPEAEVLLVSWPPMSDDLASACQAWGSNRPIVYIGEGWSGLNASYAFFKGFEPIKPQPSIPLASWDGLHDHVTFGFWKGE